MFSKDPDGIFLAASVSLFYAFGLLLFRVNQFILARSVWLFGASASNLVALVFAHQLTESLIREAWFEAFLVHFRFCPYKRAGCFVVTFDEDIDVGLERIE